MTMITRQADMRYHTGLDAGMSALIGLAIAPAAILGVVLPQTRTVQVVVGTSLSLLFWYLYRTTHYTFEEDALHVRCGPFTLAIAYDTIRRVSSSRSPMSGYAMSTHRLEIEYGRFDSVLISPADRAGVLDELRRRAPLADIGPAD